VSRFFVQSDHPVFDDVSWYRIHNNLTTNVGLCNLNDAGGGNCNNNIVSENVCFGWNAATGFVIQMNNAFRSQVMWNNLEATNGGIRWRGNSHYNHTMFNGGEQNVTPFLQYDSGAYSNVDFNWGSQTSSGVGSTVLVNDLALAAATAVGSDRMAFRSNPFVSRTDDYTLTGAVWFQHLINMNKATAVTLTLPPHASAPIGIGAHLRVRQGGAGTVTVAPGAGVTVQSALGLRTRAQYSVIDTQKIAANTWAVWGDTQV
jgi:hypothetical protein